MKWHWAATNHLSGCGLVQPIKELSSAAGPCPERGCALIRQLANIPLVENPHRPTTLAKTSFSIKKFLSW